MSGKSTLYWWSLPLALNLVTCSKFLIGLVLWGFSMITLQRVISFPFLQAIAICILLLSVYKHTTVPLQKQTVKKYWHYLGLRWHREIKYFFPFLLFVPSSARLFPSNVLVMTLVLVVIYFQVDLFTPLRSYLCYPVECILRTFGAVVGHLIRDGLFCCCPLRFIVHVGWLQTINSFTLTCVCQAHAGLCWAWWSAINCLRLSKSHDMVIPFISYHRASIFTQTFALFLTAFSWMVTEAHGPWHGCCLHYF